MIISVAKCDNTTNDWLVLAHARKAECYYKHHSSHEWYYHLKLHTWTYPIDSYCIIRHGNKQKTKQLIGIRISKPSIRNSFQLILYIQVKSIIDPIFPCLVQYVAMCFQDIYKLQQPWYISLYFTKVLQESAISSLNCFKRPMVFGP